MINEELKTFISKMRMAGKTDLEITAELKTAGWNATAINQELSSKINKTRFNLGKMKFWIWLYGIAILLSMASAIFGRMVNSHSNVVVFFAEFVGISTMIYTFAIVPIATLLVLGFKLLFWILRFIPHFKDSKSLKQLDHKWLLVVSTAITGTIMLLVGYFGARVPNGGMGTLIAVLIAILGGILLALSLIFALALIVVQKIARKNWWKVGLAVLLVVTAGIYVLNRYTKKNSYPTKPTITTSKVEFVYTSPTPLPTIILKIGDTLDYRNLQTDTSSWQEYKKEVNGLLITFKYPEQYKIWRQGNGQLADYDSLIVKTLRDGITLDSILIFFGRPYNFNGTPYTQVDDKVSLIEGVQKNYSSILDRGTTVVREIQTKSKKVVRIEYEGGWISGPAYGPSSETYVVLDNGYLFKFENYNSIPLEEFIAIIDSFKVEKCLKFC